MYVENTGLQPLRGSSLFSFIAPVAHNLQNWDQIFAADCQRILYPHWHFAKTCLWVSLSCSNSRTKCTNMRSEACGIARRISEYRLAPWRCSNSKIGFHLPPIIAIVASTAQSRSVSVVLAKSLDTSAYFYKNYFRLSTVVSLPTNRLHTSVQTSCSSAPQVWARLNGTYIDLKSLQLPTKLTLCAGIICPQSYSQTRHLLIARPKLSP